MYTFNILSPILYYILVTILLPFYNKRNTILATLLLIQLILVASFRSYEVGIDTLNYKQYYEWISDTDVREYFLMYRLEPLYIIYNKFLQVFSSDPRVLLIANAIIIYPVIVRIYYRFSPILWFSFFLYFALGFFNTSLNISRQWLAMSIIISSYPNLVNRQLGKFIIRVLTASLFHYSAILFLLTYPLLRYRISFRYLGIMLMSSLIFSFLFLPIILKFILGRFYGIYEMSSQGGYGMLGLLLITTIGGLILKPKIISKLETLLYHLMIIACALQIISLSFSIFVRVVFYWQFAITIFIPMVVCTQKQKVSKLIMIFSIMALASAYYFAVVVAPTDLQGTVPYSIE